MEKRMNSSRYSLKKAAGLTLFLCLQTACAPLGTRPSDEDIKRFTFSKNYDAETRQFQNRIPNIMEAMNKRIYNWDSVKDWMNGVEQGRPPQRMPVVVSDLNAFKNKKDGLKIIWLGHSSFMLSMNGAVILVDPVFSDSASPVSFAVKRFQEPPIPIDKLPFIDYILISHDHYDHLDMETIQHFKERSTQFVVPLGVKGHLIGWGVKPERIFEKDWWEEAVFSQVTFTATPAQHFSGRDGIHPNETLWASWVIHSPDHKVYFSGDSGYDTHFKTIGAKLGPFDVVFLDSGQYNKKWREVHMMPEEAVKAAQDLNAKYHFPVHWGMFELALHNWDEPVRRVMAAQNDESVPVLTPKLGEMLQLPDPAAQTRWWESLR